MTSDDEARVIDLSAGETPPAKKGRIKLVFVALLQVAITGAILALLSQIIGFRSVGSSLAQANIAWVLAAIGVLVLQQLIGAIRWRRVTVLLGGIGQRLEFYALWQGVAAVLLQVLPSTVGGDIVRMGSGARASGLGLGAGVVIVDRVIGMAMLCILVALGSGIFAELLTQQPALLIPLGMAIAGLLGCGVVMLSADFLRGRRLALRLDALGRSLRTSLKGPVALHIWGNSLLIHALSILAVLFLLRATHAPEADWLSLSFVVSSAFLVSALPISLGGWGVREGAFVVGLGLIGLSDEIALTISVLFGLSLTGSGVVLTLLALVSKSLRPLGRDERVSS
jgi:glycosyltransferase 2 family protein